ncbi:hypothetical protein SAMN04487899_11839, partial [Segatella bryantii]
FKDAYPFIEVGLKPGQKLNLTVRFCYPFTHIYNM